MIFMAQQQFRIHRSKFDSGYRIKHDGYIIHKITRLEEGMKARVIHPNNYPKWVLITFRVMLVAPIGENLEIGYRTAPTQMYIIDRERS